MKEWESYGEEQGKLNISEIGDELSFLTLMNGGW